MSTRKAKIVVMVALFGAAFVVACGSGSDPVITLGSPYEQGPGAFDKPTTSNQDPSPAQAGSAGGTAATTNPEGSTKKDGGSTTNTSGGTSGGTSGATSGGTSGATSGGTSGATSGGTSGTTSGGTSGGTMAGCPPCDGTFTCDVTITGSMMTQRTTVMLVTKNGACTFSSQGSDVVFACGGKLTSGGQNVGTWANCSK